MRKKTGLLVAGFGALVWLLNWIGVFQTAESVTESRSMKFLMALVTSQYFPLCVFVMGVVLIVCAQFDISLWPQRHRPELLPFSTKVSNSGKTLRFLIGLRNGAAISAAGKLARIDSQVSCHVLRYSFATHLLEQG